MRNVNDFPTRSKEAPMDADARTVFASRADLNAYAKRNPGKVLVLDGGAGWTSKWVSERKGKEPKCVGAYNPEGMLTTAS
jgi:hypothetical protein